MPKVKKKSVLQRQQEAKIRKRNQRATEHAESLEVGNDVSIGAS